MKIKKIIVFVIILVAIILFSLYFYKYKMMASATNDGWSIGSSGVINTEQCGGTGAMNWMMDKVVFLLSPYELSSFELKDGRKNLIKSFESVVPAYSEATIAIIPYDFTAYLNRQGFNDLKLMRRISWDTTKVSYFSSKEDLNAVKKMTFDAEAINGKFNNTAFTEGVYYNKLKELNEKGQLSKWKSNDVLTAENINKSNIVWSWITRLDSDSKSYNVTQRIDQYLHFDKLNIDPDNMDKADDKMVKELRLRYIDLLMTLYGQAKDSVAALHWEKAIDTYIKGTYGTEYNSCHIAVSAGFIARGMLNTTSKNGKQSNELTNLLGSCQDMLDYSFTIENEYSLGILEKSKKVSNILTSEGQKTTYYNRFLKSLELSVKAQVGQNVKRTYKNDSIFGSPIQSRIIRNRVNIVGSKVTWGSIWNELSLIEHLALKKEYFGTMLIPAYDGPDKIPELEASLKVATTLKDFEGEEYIKFHKYVTCLNDKPTLSIQLMKKRGVDSDKLWEQFLDKNKYFIVKIEIVQKALGETNLNPPKLVLEEPVYIKAPKGIRKSELELSFKNSKPFHTWTITSLYNRKIEPEQYQEYRYKATVDLYYSATEKTDITKMSKLTATTKEDKIRYLNKKPITPPPPSPSVTPTPEPEYGLYVSEPDAYSELKEGSVYNETFEAMAGVPSTKTLYFGSGGSEFMVEVETLYDYDKHSTRKYRSYFAGNVSCEFKESDNAKTATLGGQTVALHNGGTYIKTWTGSIPNKARAVTALHNASCPAEPDYTAYNAAKEAATEFAKEVNGTTLSYTSGSDKKTRSYKDWGASISMDSKNDPVATADSKTCSKKDAVVVDGETVVEAVPCGNEMATANPGAAGSYAITVTWTVPAHVICGPCCEHTLASVEDTWSQIVTFDTLKITDVRVWKLDSSYVGGMEEITYDDNEYITAKIVQGDPNIFYNIASNDTSAAGRLRYSLQQGQHDFVTWYERNSNSIETRSNKCDGLSGTISSVNPVPVAKGQGHLNSWATGILYNNKTYPNKVNYHTSIFVGKKSGMTSDSTDSIDKNTIEYQRFDERRNQQNTVTVISDMLILQTSSGDQSVVYFEAKDTATAQTNFKDIQVTFQQMWDNNTLSASKWSQSAINIGSYNGQYYNTSSKYKGTGSNTKIATAFDQDASKASGTDEFGKARVVNSITYRPGSDNKSSPGSGQYRMASPNALLLYVNKIKQDPTNPNKAYSPAQSYAYYRQLLSYTNDKATGNANIHSEELTINNMNQFGYTIESKYRNTDAYGSVNGIIVHNPVSVEDASIVSLPVQMDQRTSLPIGSAQSVLDELAHSQVCPLSPALCEYRVKNCKYFMNTVKGSFDFEQVNTFAEKEEGLLDDTTLIRSLIKSTAGASLSYELPNGFSIGVDGNGLGTGRYLRVNGTRLGIELSDMGISYDKNLSIKIEANIFIPSSYSNKMIFSFDGLGFYVPAGKNYGVFLTGNGEEKKVNYSITDSHIKLGLVFSFGDLNDCEVYVNNVKITSSTANSNTIKINDSMIGYDLYIGTWTKDSSYTTGYILDNLTVARMAGSSTHTSACIDVIISHEVVEQYTCGNKTKGVYDLKHVHTIDCTSIISENNTHVHTSSCKEINLEVLKTALDAYDSGNALLLSQILGNELYEDFVNKYGDGGTSGTGKVLAEIIYSGDHQTFALKKGTYLLEAWGAQGGKSQRGEGGLGAYAYGEFTLKTPENIYVYVGGKGGDKVGSIDLYDGLNNNGGFNGGGSGTGSAGPGGGGGTDFRFGGVGITNRILVAGGGGGGNGTEIISNNNFFQGSNGCTSRHASSYPNDEGGGGGGYYGGQTSHGDDTQSGFSGTSFVGTLANAIVLNGQRSGNGYAKITSLKTTPSAEEYKNEIINLLHKIPSYINKGVNPLFKCDGIYNKHKCTTICREIKVLNCLEPHHNDSCYDYDNDTCWDACKYDGLHKTIVSKVTNSKGEVIDCGTFISLDNYFRVYFPNNGDFYGTGEFGISNISMNRGKGYMDNMNTLEWLREKRVRFAFNVLFYRNGVWEQVSSGEWITLPIRSGGKELEYYEFYCLLANAEVVAANVEFMSEAINCTNSPGGKENPYLGDNLNNADCVYDSNNVYQTNKKRFWIYTSYHSAYKRVYTDVVGRIGNLIMEDTNDLRFANFFKQSKKNNCWIVEGIIPEVDISLPKSYLSWFYNNGSFGKDIRNVLVNPLTGMYNTYGTQKWTEGTSANSFPLSADKNPLESMKENQLKPGYNVLFDISTIGDYQDIVQAVPYFYALDIDTDKLTPVDVYMNVSGQYQPISYFGLYSDYVNLDNTLSETYYKLRDNLYKYVMSINWTQESKRRNYTQEEEKTTKYLAENFLEFVTDEYGNAITHKYITIPFGDNYALGTIQLLLAGKRARTFIGSSKVNTVDINGGKETNIFGYIAERDFMDSAQRWHLTLGVPSSVTYVAYRNKTHIEPLDMITIANGERIRAIEEFKDKNIVILMTADIKALGNRFTLGYHQGGNNGVLRINGKVYKFGNDIPTLLAVYDSKVSSALDIDFIGTH